METDWTPDRIRQAARSHASYGWSKSYGGHTGRAWTTEDEKIYDEEYALERERIKNGGGSPTLGRRLWTVAAQFIGRPT
jgi:hypothetical protein